MVRSNDKDEVSKRDDTDDPAKPKAVDSDVSKIKSVDSTDKDSQPFFKTTRNVGLEQV